MVELCKITDWDVCGDDRLSEALPSRIAARAILLDSNFSIALLHIGKYGYYTLPGGGVEEGESLEEALKREMLEETGCDCTIISEFGYVLENRARIDVVQITNYFVAKVEGKKGVVNLTPDEIEEQTQLGWYPLKKAFQLVNVPPSEHYQGNCIRCRDIAVLKLAMESREISQAMIG